MRSLALAAALLAPAAALAHPTVGARAAIAPALGSAAAEVPMADVAGLEVPLALEALWRAGPLAAGAYGAWAPGRASGAACGGGASCSASTLRAGVLGTWALRPPPRWPTPWVGAGVGWEWASLRRERLGSAIKWRWSGPEAFVEGGAEWRLAERFALGPYARLAVGRYGRLALETPVASASSDVGERALHAFVHAGVRVRVDL